MKIWQCLPDDFTKWTTIADLKLPSAATAVAFAPSDESDEFVIHRTLFEYANVPTRRMLAVGLETGDILLYTSVDAVNWQMSLEIKAGYEASAAAQINVIHRVIFLGWLI